MYTNGSSYELPEFLFQTCMGCAMGKGPYPYQQCSHPIRSRPAHLGLQYWGDQGPPPHGPHFLRLCFRDLFA